MQLRYWSKKTFGNDLSALLLLWVVYNFFFGQIWYVQQSSLGLIVGISITSTLGVLMLSKILKRELRENFPEAFSNWQMSGIRLVVYAIGIGFIAGEFALGMLFLPFSYVTQATLLALAFFLFWRTLKLRYSRKLTARVLAQEISMVICALVFILLTTPWLPK